MARKDRRQPQEYIGRNHTGKRHEEDGLPRNDGGMFEEEKESTSVDTKPEAAQREVPVEDSGRRTEEETT
jgi:hypothetical protein